MQHTPTHAHTALQTLIGYVGLFGLVGTAIKIAVGAFQK